MKKLSKPLIIIISLFILLYPAWLYRDANALVIMGGYYGGAVAPDCSEYFPAGDNGDVAGNSNFDAETDVNTKLSIASNEMVFDAGTSSQVGYVIETSCVADSDLEYTIKFTIEADDILDVDDGTSYMQILTIRSDGTEEQAYVRIKCVDGDITTYTSTLNYDGGAIDGNVVTMTGLAADTSYQCYAYFKKNATTGEFSFKIGAWAESTSGAQDNDGKEGGGTIRLGGIDHYWGDGATDTFLKFDNFEVYKSDQMP